MRQRPMPLFWAPGDTARLGIQPILLSESTPAGNVTDNPEFFIVEDEYVLRVLTADISVDVAKLSPFPVVSTESSQLVFNVLVDRNADKAFCSNFLEAREVRRLERANHFNKSIWMDRQCAARAS